MSRLWRAIARFAALRTRSLDGREWVVCQNLVSLRRDSITWPGKATAQSILERHRRNDTVEAAASGKGFAILAELFCQKWCFFARIARGFGTWQTP